MTRGQFIAYKRECCGFKKMEFSKLMGVGADSLHSWEKDKFKPSGINLRNLVKNLKLTKDEIKKYFEYEYVPTNEL